MLWIKVFHLFFVISWFAGLFYLPRIFVNLAMVSESSERERLLLMAGKLWRFMQPLMVLTLAFGLELWLYYGIGLGAGNGWMHAKLVIVVLLLFYHFACGALLRQLRAGRCSWSHKAFRWFNEAPTLLLFGALVLVILKPF